MHTGIQLKVIHVIAYTVLYVYTGLGRQNRSGRSGGCRTCRLPDLPMFTPSLRHDDVLLALTIQYYTSAAVTGHLSNWILPLSILLRVKLVWPARLLHVDRAFVEAPPIIERDPQSRISHVTLSMRTNERVLGDWYFTSGDYFGCLS